LSMLSTWGGAKVPTWAPLRPYSRNVSTGVNREPLAPFKQATPRSVSVTGGSYDP
jgi:hypothetical protein